jgi:hypothetical protein
LGGDCITEKTCVKCSRKISLDKNLYGLVFNDEIFLCENCCNKQSDKDLMNWTKTTMHSPQSGMPIAIWLIHEQNRNKIIMSENKENKK